MTSMRGERSLFLTFSTTGSDKVCPMFLLVVLGAETVTGRHTHARWYFWKLTRTAVEDGRNSIWRRRGWFWMGMDGCERVGRRRGGDREREREPEAPISTSCGRKQQKNPPRVTTTKLLTTTWLPTVSSTLSPLTTSYYQKADAQHLLDQISVSSQCDTERKTKRKHVTWPNPESSISRDQ